MRRPVVSVRAESWVRVSLWISPGEIRRRSRVRVVFEGGSDTRLRSGGSRSVSLGIGFSSLGGRSFRMVMPYRSLSVP